ncbi:MAG: hypothetical protein U9R75_04325, partial [Candidatus Thermoplasmatota archaeon]|nr:hypothetical protein [Candidatus Thermoplasmatota archaeon]
MQTRWILSFFIMVAMIMGGMPILLSFESEDSVGAVGDVDPPTRGGLYQHSETHNVTFSKPTFYGDKDANYPANDLDNNSWDEIGFVVFFQDQHKTSKTVAVFEPTV